MSKYFYLILFATLFSKAGLNAQSQRYIVKPTAFSSRINDEFSPVFYKDGIVFCSNLRDNSLVGLRMVQTGYLK